MDEQPRRKKRPVPPARRFAAKRMYSLAVGVAVVGLLVGFVIGRATAPVAEADGEGVVAEDPIASWDNTRSQPDPPGQTDPDDSPLAEPQQVDAPEVGIQRPLSHPEQATGSDPEHDDGVAEADSGSESGASESVESDTERITSLSRIQLDVGYIDVDFNNPIEDEELQRIAREMAVDSLRSLAHRGFTIRERDIEGRQGLYSRVLIAAIAARTEQQRQVDIQCGEYTELAQRVAERVANYPPSTMEATMWETAEERAEQTVAQWKAAIIREMDLERRAGQRE